MSEKWQYSGMDIRRPILPCRRQRASGTELTASFPVFEAGNENAREMLWGGQGPPSIWRWPVSTETQPHSFPPVRTARGHVPGGVWKAKGTRPQCCPRAGRGASHRERCIPHTASLVRLTWQTPAHPYGHQAAPPGLANPRTHSPSCPIDSHRALCAHAGAREESPTGWSGGAEEHRHQGY